MQIRFPVERVHAIHSLAAVWCWSQHQKIYLCDSVTQFEKGNHFLLKDVGFMWSGEFDVGVLLSHRKYSQLEDCTWETWLNKKININYNNWNENEIIERKWNEKAN